MKLAEIVIISEELLKLYSNISRNTSVEKVFPYVILAQSFYLEDILGTYLLNELKEQVANELLTDENQALILKIAPYLSLATEFLALRGLAYSVTQKGITKENSDNSQSLSKEELRELEHDIANKMEMAEKLLIKYLCQCQNLYPLWKPSTPCQCSQFNETEGSNEQKNHYHIYFPKQRKNECNQC